MKEISLHILDIVQNSITAGAMLIEVAVDENPSRDTLTVTIKDDGCGMDQTLLSAVTSPFVTTRTTRKVGLGIPLFKVGAESSGGSFSIQSKEGEGTAIAAVYTLSHIDRPPLGNMAETLIALIATNGEKPDFLYTHKVAEKEFMFDTRMIREAVGGLPLSLPDIVAWMRENLQEGIAELNGGA